jgi:serine/threonine protein kinase
MLRSSTHGDIKPEDILIDLFGCAHIGLAKVSDSENAISRQKYLRFNRSISSENQIPLEIIELSKESVNLEESKTDIFNLGHTLLFALDPENYQSKRSFNSIVACISKKVPATFFELLKKMLEPSPTNRPTILHVAKVFAKNLGQPMPVEKPLLVEKELDI